MITETVNAFVGAEQDEIVGQHSYSQWSIAEFFSNAGDVPVIDKHAHYDACNYIYSSSVSEA